ncbi:hypothetical protein LG307_02515 [Sutcliffiella horikoshii]|uniref:hypothetical protein n=1 Tax=Sutcliffiella horikoshii TaxID=79883 RepID=UPI0038509384
MFIIWGGLMLYFIIPFHKNDEVSTNVPSMKVAVKLSLQRVTFHRKFLLAIFLLILSYLAIWYSFKDMTWYNEAHGVPNHIDAAETLSFYLIAVTLYTLLLYSAAVVMRAFSYMKEF